MKQQLVFTNNPGEALDKFLSDLRPSSLFVIVDSNVRNLVLPRLKTMSSALDSAEVIEIPADDINKNLGSLTEVWQRLNVGGATRSSLVINLGGGMVTDLGGFAAATFKRGMRFINVPTTLLAAVDASVGGKTGINFNGFKNEIGVFAEAEASVISTLFFNTLPAQELLSGYAEMLKHALLENRETFSELLDYRIEREICDHDKLLALLSRSVEVKKRIVSADMHENGLRKALNLGHTVGHAFESFALRHSPIPHGYAVAWGMVVELILSHLRLSFPSDVLHAYSTYVRSNYGAFGVTCNDYPALLSLMLHDKKNASADKINFTLLRDVGDIRTDCVVDNDTIKAALDIYCDLMGI